jgi:hypothetical protein
VPTHPPIQLIPGALSPGIKRPGFEAHHLLSSNAEVKNGGAIPPLLHTSLWCGASVIRHNFTFTVLQYILSFLMKRVKFNLRSYIDPMTD